MKNETNQEPTIQLVFTKDEISALQDALNECIYAAHRKLERKDLGDIGRRNTRVMLDKSISLFNRIKTL